MKPQIVMSPKNAQLVIATPLYRLYKNEYTVEKVGYELAMSWPDPRPLAYVLDCGDFCQVVGAEWVEKNLIFMGEL